MSCSINHSAAISRYSTEWGFYFDAEVRKISKTCIPERQRKQDDHQADCRSSSARSDSLSLPNTKEFQKQNIILNLER